MGSNIHRIIRQKCLDFSRSLGVFVSNQIRNFFRILRIDFTVIALLGNTIFIHFQIYKRFMQIFFSKTRLNLLWNLGQYSALSPFQKV